MLGVGRHCPRREPAVGGTLSTIVGRGIVMGQLHFLGSVNRARALPLALRESVCRSVAIASAMGTLRDS